MPKDNIKLSASALPALQSNREADEAKLAKIVIKPRSVNNKESSQCVCALIKSENFSLYYGTKAGVKNITMDIYPCSVTSIIGPSGCGKSTFLRSINRMNDLIPHVRAEGKLLVDGQDIYDKRTNLVNLRQQVGMVFQKPNPFPKSIFDNVAYGPRLQGIKNRSELQRIVEESLKAAALWSEVKDDLKKTALALSGGQQQRLCIARALATKPSVLLMDEPCSALDPIATGKIEDLIENLKSDYTIVIVTHNMQQAARVSERAAFFCLGELIEYDFTSKIFSNPGKKQTEDYVTGRFG
ncbi:MAG: phosphate ABC transporter ATP-binding protein PstB [Phycisphaerales bacterium]